MAKNFCPFLSANFIIACFLSVNAHGNGIEILGRICGRLGSLPAVKGSKVST